MAESISKLADARRKSWSETANRLLRERLEELVKEREAQALAEVRALERDTPIGRLKAWVAEQNASGVLITEEALAAKKAELGA